MRAFAPVGGPLLAALAMLVLVAPAGAVGTASPSLPAAPHASPASLAAPVRPAVRLPDPRSYSALGDSITTGYDSDGSFDLSTEGPQPWFAYALGNYSGNGAYPPTLSIYQRLLRLYPNTSTEKLTAHLEAVPGDRASDIIWQSVRAVQNQSGFVTILIGGNDVCDGSGTTYTPTPVWNFSASINHSLQILTNGLGRGVVIGLGDVVNVTHLWTLFGGNEQAQLVWENTCPALLTTSGRALMQYMIPQYNHIEQLTVQRYDAMGYDVSLFDIENYSFSVDDVNHLDFFHPSPSGHNNLASQWWSALPYSTESPLFTSSPALPATVPVGTQLPVAVEVRDPVPPTVTVTYKETGAFFWTTRTLSLESGEAWNGTFNTTLPFNATDVVGGLQLYFTATDPDGYWAVLPGGSTQGPTSLYDVQVTSTESTTYSPLASVSLSSAPTSLPIGGTITFTATAWGANGFEEHAGVAYAWNLQPASLGQVIPEGNQSQALFEAGGEAGTATIEVTAYSGVGNRSMNATFTIQAAPPTTNIPPATPGPTPSAQGSALPDLGLLLIVVPVVALGAAAGLGLLLRRRDARRKVAGKAPAK